MGKKLLHCQLMLKIQDQNIQNLRNQISKRLLPNDNGERKRSPPLTLHSPTPSRIINLPERHHLIEAFSEFFDEVLENFCLETNLKSVQRKKPGSVSVKKIKVFLGINIIMGYYSLPQLQYYRSNRCC